MGDQDLAMAFSNPNVQKAVLDISSNPMNIVNYQNDPEVMKARRPLCLHVCSVPMRGVTSAIACTSLRILTLDAVHGCQAARTDG